MLVHGLSVCVNYCDLLKLAWEHNKTILSSYVIVTSFADRETQEFCAKEGITCIVSNSYLEDGATFNKSKMLNVGLKYIYEQHPSEWVLILDVDIIVKCPRFLFLELSPDKIYGAKRKIFETYNDYINDNGWVQEIGSYPYAQVGYFQLFNKQNIYYDESFKTASDCDTKFFYDHFNLNLTYTFSPEFLMCSHLGPIEQNWEGRKTERWVIK